MKEHYYGFKMGLNEETRGNNEKVHDWSFRAGVVPIRSSTRKMFFFKILQIKDKVKKSLLCKSKTIRDIWRHPV